MSTTNLQYLFNPRSSAVIGAGIKTEDPGNIIVRNLISGGFAGPENVASAIAMFASDDGKFITGTELRIDGGTHM